MLPKARIELSEPFHTTGVDFAGPLLYKMGKKKVSKAYVILFTCASTRAVHLALCKTMTIDGFQRNLRWFVARRGKPQVIIDDNAKTLIAAKKWLECLTKSEDANSYLSTERIK